MRLACAFLGNAEAWTSRSGASRPSASATLRAPPRMTATAACATGRSGTSATCSSTPSSASGTRVGGGGGAGLRAPRDAAEGLRARERSGSW